MVGPKTNMELNKLSAGVRSDLHTIDEAITRRLLEKDDEPDIRQFLRGLMELTKCTTDQLFRYVRAVREESEEKP